MKVIECAVHGWVEAVSDKSRKHWCHWCKPEILAQALAQQGFIDGYFEFLDKLPSLPSEEGIDLVYEYIDPWLARNPALVNGLLAELDPVELAAEVSVAVLVITLPLKEQLLNRKRFIERARVIFEREDEGADAVLHGLL